MKTKAIPRKPLVLIVRLVRLAIMLAALPLFITALYMALAYGYGYVFLGLFLFFIAYSILAVVSLVDDVTLLQSITNFGQYIWKLTSLDKE